jgi:hypothetical protein
MLSQLSDSNKSRDIVSWDEEVCRAENAPGYEAPLPDLSEWRNPFWSSILQQETRSDDQTETSQKESVEVNTFIHELNSDYVMSDGDYAEVLRNLRDAPSERSVASEQQAGPSHPKEARSRRHKVAVEEVTDEDSQSDQECNELIRHDMNILIIIRF